MRELYKNITIGKYLRSYGLLFFIFLSVQVHAQHKIQSLAEIQAKLGAKPAQFNEIQSLLYNVNSAIYLDDSLTSYGSAPKVMYSTMNTITDIHQIKSGLETIELLQIDATTGNNYQNIEDSVFEKLLNLKYVYYLIGNDQQRELLLSKVPSSKHIAFYEVIIRK